MKTNKQQVGSLLEQYVFSMAINYIESVDLNMQTKLIHLFNQIGKDLSAGAYMNLPNE